MSSFTSHIRKWKFEGFLFSAKDEVELNSRLDGSKVISFSPHSVVECYIFLTTWRIYCKVITFLLDYTSLFSMFTILDKKPASPKQRTKFLKAENRSQPLYSQRCSGSLLNLLSYFYGPELLTPPSTFHFHSYLISGFMSLVLDIVLENVA